MTSETGLGFVGLGTMGEAMALNLVKSGRPLTVWNRSATKCEPLRTAGATIADTPGDLFATCDVIFLMLADGTAIDAVLARGGDLFHQRIVGRTLVNMATVPPSYSRALAAEIRGAGGRYVEAPVSGSRVPAEAGQLVAMLAGEADDISVVRSLITPMCRHSVACGPVPGALTMKLAVNLFLITMVTGLAEATHFARQHGLDLATFAAVLDAGPMASDVSRVKLAKFLDDDFTRQAAITDVLKNNRLVVDAARETRIATPLIDMCLDLNTRTNELGHGNEDMIAVIRAIERMTAAIQ